MLIQEILRQIRDLHAEAEAPEGPYSDGYRDALTMCEEIITDVMWENGVDYE